MIIRLSVVAYLIVAFASFVFFLVGDAIVDPSFEYQEPERTWLLVTQWLVLLVPLVGFWLLMRLANAPSKDHDA